jgi:hypothetical protein
MTGTLVDLMAVLLGMWVLLAVAATGLEDSGPKKDSDGRGK